jgi:hypothetical protein
MAMIASPTTKSRLLADNAVGGSCIEFWLPKVRAGVLEGAT